MHEQLLASAHRTLDAAAADFFYVPLYMSCAILPVYDWSGPPAYQKGYPMRPVTAMRMAYDALEHVRAAHRLERPRHLRPSLTRQPTRSEG